MAINDDYLEQTEVLLKSLFDNNDENIEIIILDSDLSKHSKMIIKRILERYGYGLRFVSVDKNMFRNAPKRQNISIETYFRLLAFDLLYDIKKILYLDADMIIDGSLKELWETNIDDHCIAGVADQGTVQNDLYHRAGLGLKKDSVYINGGVLLMNLENMRKRLSVDKIFSFIDIMGDRLKYQDQDVINVLFEDDILPLPIKFNCAPIYKNGQDFIEHYFHPRKRIKPIIIHYMGEMKPWKDFYGYKYFWEYSKYCNRAECRILKRKILLNCIRRPFSLIMQYHDERFYNS